MPHYHELRLNNSWRNISMFNKSGFQQTITIIVVREIIFFNFEGLYCKKNIILNENILRNTRS